MAMERNITAWLGGDVGAISVLRVLQLYQERLGHYLQVRHDLRGSSVKQERVHTAVPLTMATGVRKWQLSEQQTATTALCLAPTAVFSAAALGRYAAPKLLI
jgi:hypothetical protein